MAANDIATFAPGVVRDECVWGYILEGEKVNLLRSGLAQESWFSTGQRDKRGRVIRTIYIQHEGRKVRCTEQQRKGHYEVSTFFTAEELDRAGQRKQFEKAAAVAAFEFGLLSKDAEDFRKDNIKTVESFINAYTRVWANSRYDGYYLPPDTIAEIQRLGHQIVMAIESGKIIFNRANRSAVETKIRVKSAKQDPALQAFMERVTGTQ